MKKTPEKTPNARALEKRMNRGFTLKEKEVIRLICLEKSTKEIAEILDNSIRTIETDRQYIMKKIGCKNAIGIVFYALKTGIYSIK